MAQSLKVLLLSPYPEMLHHALDMTGDSYVHYDDNGWVDSFDHADYDFVVSFGHRALIKDPFILESYKDKMINIHLSFLPWNRGADPNFWSWFDDTPKGVTIHRIDAGIDTGNIIVQQHLNKWTEGETLKSSYYYLLGKAKGLFEDNWKNIRRDALPTRKPEPDVGSTHKKADKDVWFNQLSGGWDTPVREVRKLGKSYRSSQDSQKEDRGPRVRKHRQQTLPEL